MSSKYRVPSVFNTLSATLAVFSSTGIFVIFRVVDDFTSLTLSKPVSNVCPTKIETLSPNPAFLITFILSLGVVLLWGSDISVAFLLEMW